MGRGRFEHSYPPMHCICVLIRFIHVLIDGEMDDDGFYMGELNGRRGLVPSNFLTDVPSGYIFMDQTSSHQSFPFANNSSRPSSNMQQQQQQPRILGTQRRW